MRTTLNIDNEILEDDVDCVTAASSTGMRMTVHRQVTDAYSAFSRAGAFGGVRRRRIAEFTGSCPGVGSRVPTFELS